MKTTESKTTTQVQTKKEDNRPFFSQEGQDTGVFTSERPFFASGESSAGHFFNPSFGAGGLSKATNSPQIQAKLSIGAPDDPYEREADAMAEKVVQRLAVQSSPDAPPATGDTLSSSSALPVNGVQRKCAECEQEEKIQEKEDLSATGEQLQRKPIFDSNTEPPDDPGLPPMDEGIQRKCASCGKEINEEMGGGIQRKSNGEMSASPDVATRLNASKGGGSPLADNTRTSMESAFGADFSGVRVHTGSEAVQMSRDLSAQAFTHGKDVYFGEGKYNPGTREGGRLLAHELTHVGQQGGGIALFAQTKPDAGSYKDSEEANQNINAEPEFEKYKGAEINAAGKVSSPANQYADAKSIGLKLRHKPATTDQFIDRVVYDTTIFIKAYDNQGGWVYIVSMNGKAGWINKDFVAWPLPDPDSNLHHITELNLESILKEKYSSYPTKSGDDLRGLATAILIANEGRKGLKIDWNKLDESLWANWFVNSVDPWNSINRVVYQSVDIKTGHNIWLPSIGYVNHLKESGAVLTRPEFINTLIDVGKGVSGFVAGIFEGFFGGIIDALEGIWELGKSIIDTVGKVITGEILNDINALYDFFKDLSWDKAKEIGNAILSGIWDGFTDFKKKWENPDIFEKWRFIGDLVGTILLEVLVAIFTAGAGNVAKWIGKLGKIAPKLTSIIHLLFKKEIRK